MRRERSRGSSGKIQPDIISSINNIHNDAGNIEITGTNGINVQNDSLNRRIIISGSSAGDTAGVNYINGVAADDSGNITLQPGPHIIIDNMPDSNSLKISAFYDTTDFYADTLNSIYHYSDSAYIYEFSSHRITSDYTITDVLDSVRISFLDTVFMNTLWIGNSGNLVFRINFCHFDTHRQQMFYLSKFFTYTFSHHNRVAAVACGKTYCYCGQSIHTHKSTWRVFVILFYDGNVAETDTVSVFACNNEVFNLFYRLKCTTHVKTHIKVSRLNYTRINQLVLRGKGIFVCLEVLFPNWQVFRRRYRH